jgi:predicted ATP-grasp superfamily ATP-dependent carboligase
MSAFITTGESIKALTVARSLGNRGIPLTIGSSEKYSLAACSRYCQSKFIYPSPSHTQQFVNTLTQFLNHNHYDVLIPVHSKDTIIISKYKHKFEQYTTIPLPAYDTMVTLSDKSKIPGIAEELDIPIPKTFIPSKNYPLNEIAEVITYPAIIKLRNRTSSMGQSYAFCADDLCKKYQATIQTYNLLPNEYPIIQEYINGIGYGVSMLYNEGEVRAKFTHKRIREYPVTGGPSTYRISTTHAKMESIAEKLLSHYSWHGVAMVEFKLSNDGHPYLIEVNPRFWGSLNTAVLSGVDFPYLLYLMAIEGDIPKVMNYNTNVVSMNYCSDTIARCKLLRSKKTLQELKKSLIIPYHDDIFSFNDPLPFFRFIVQGLMRGKQNI